MCLGDAAAPLPYNDEPVACLRVRLIVQVPRHPRPQIPRRRQRQTDDAPGRDLLNEGTLRFCRVIDQSPFAVDALAVERGAHRPVWHQSLHAPVAGRLEAAPAHVLTRRGLAKVAVAAEVDRRVEKVCAKHARFVSNSARRLYALGDPAGVEVHLALHRIEREPDNTA